MTHRCKTALLLFLWGPFISTLSVNAEGPGSASGISLLQTPSARAAALGEAFSAEAGDVTAYLYNPATLNTLQFSQASFLYQSGLADDRTSHLTLGLSRGDHDWGFSVGYYDGGEVEVFDGSYSRMVTAKRDLTTSIAVARPWGPFSLGVAGKYLYSELAETANASAVAFDGGAFYRLNDRFQFGASIQNLGSDLQYDQSKETLPVLLRPGMSCRVLKGASPLHVNFDVPYELKDQQWSMALGAEFRISHVALRAGYNSLSDLGGLSLGTGIRWKDSSFDYSVGLMDEFDSRHLVSFSQRFGKSSPDEFVKKELDPSLYMIRERDENSQQIRNLYVVCSGDTLEDIAYKVYGDRRLWTAIFFANSHTLKTPSVKDKVGMKLVIP